MKNGPFLSVLDAEAFGAYTFFCGATGSRPWTLEQWLLMTERSTVNGFELWAKTSQHDPNTRIANAAPHISETPNLEHEPEAAPSVLSREDQLKLRDLKQQIGPARELVVGFLRKDGGLRSTPAADSFEGAVRRQALASNRRGVTPSPLTARTCHNCNALKPARCFAKQGDGLRAICKRCDNKLRVARRRQSRVLVGK